MILTWSGNRGHALRAVALAVVGTILGMIGLTTALAATLFVQTIVAPAQIVLFACWATCSWGAWCELREVEG